MYKRRAFFFYDSVKLSNICSISCKSFTLQNALYYYKKFSVESENYDIYECVSNCPNENPFLFPYLRGFECVNKCDEEKGMMYISLLKNRILKILNLTKK